MVIKHPDWDNIKLIKHPWQSGVAVQFALITEIPDLVHSPYDELTDAQLSFLRGEDKEVTKHDVFRMKVLLGESDNPSDPPVVEEVVYSWARPLEVQVFNILLEEGEVYAPLSDEQLSSLPVRKVRCQKCRMNRDWYDDYTGPVDDKRKVCVYCERADALERSA